MDVGRLPTEGGRFNADDGRAIEGGEVGLDDDGRVGCCGGVSKREEVGECVDEILLCLLKSSARADTLLGPDVSGGALK